MLSHYSALDSFGLDSIRRKQLTGFVIRWFSLCGLKLRRKWANSGAGSGAGLYLNLVRFYATRCDVENRCKYLIKISLFDTVRHGAVGCFRGQRGT